MNWIAVVLQLATGLCKDGTVVTCSTANCAHATTECISGYWSECRCDCGPQPCVTTYSWNGSYCVYTFAASGASCSDGNICNGDEICDGRGTCVKGTNRASGFSCSDGNVCNGDEVCSGTGLCLRGSNRAAGYSCSDGNACNGQETCDGAGLCRSGTPPVLDDGNACTADFCDPATNSVVHVAAPTGTECSELVGCACDSARTCRASVDVTNFCYDERGNITRKVQVAAGAACTATCD